MSEDPKQLEDLIDRLAAALAAALPWAAFLPEQEREAFATDAADTLRACMSTGSFTEFSQLLEEWRNTAEIWSDPGLAALLSAETDIEEDG